MAQPEVSVIMLGDDGVILLVEAGVNVIFDHISHIA